jgi:predicted DNA-binding antitoxin AbrB/MazE fold protein
MSESIAAVYRKGVLRPLKPLNLQENSQVEIQIVVKPPQKSEAQEARQALIRAGVVRPRAADKAPHPVTEAEALAAAQAIGAAGSLSDMILADREGR